MKFVKIRTSATKEQLLEMLSDNDRTNKGVTFDEKYGKPYFHVKENDGALRVKCEYMGGATKDNAFVDGTAFRGRIREKNGVTTVTGAITTALIFHLFMLALLGVFVYQCIAVGGFNVVPLCLIAFDVFMFYKEFKKQGLIFRYLQRAVRKCEAEKC